MFSTLSHVAHENVLTITVISDMFVLITLYSKVITIYRNILMYRDVLLNVHGIVTRFYMGVVLRQPLDRLSAILHAVSKIYKAAILHISHTKDAFNSSVVKILVFHTYIC